ncbi:hypothetical protein HDV01_007699 [Terramyces sp. JEL0728]|nr:hypothetical protein HDV01_007699 [Terramyces sp. JEL0728]
MQKKIVRRWIILIILAMITYFVFANFTDDVESGSCYQQDGKISSWHRARNFRQCVSSLLDDYDFKDMNKTKELLINFNLLNRALTDSGIGSGIFHLIKTLHAFEQSKLLDWFLPGITISKLSEKFIGRAFVISALDTWFATAYFSVLHIRNYHKNTLPIYIFHNGTELSAKNIRLLRKIKDVSVFDLQEYYDDTKVSFSGYATKTAVILIAPCQECIFLDCDAWFFQNPLVMFEQNAYKETGLMLFKDRSKDGSTDGMEWVKDLVPESELSKIDKLRIYNGKTFHEAESGMVVIDKKRRFINMLAIAYMNEATIIPQSHDGFHGDKETFWIGSAMVQQPFSFNERLPYTIGNFEPNYNPGRFCSTQMAHADSNGKLLWIHGGVTKNKYIVNSTLQEFNHWSPEVGDYHWMEKDGQLCMELNRNPVHELTSDAKLVFTKAQLLWNEAIKNI